jgi:hypothetical protein
VNEGGTIKGELKAIEEIVFMNSTSSLSSKEETNYIIEEEEEKEEEESIQNNNNFRLLSSSLQSPSSTLQQPDYRPNKLFPFCMNPCQPTIIIKPQNSSSNNSTITKAMRYSQYIRNSQNKKTIFL